MYDLHEMDERYILQSIEKNDVINNYFKKHLSSNIKYRNRLSKKEKDIIIFSIIFNNDLSDRYREMLINIMKEV